MQKKCIYKQPMEHYIILKGYLARELCSLRMINYS